MEEHTEHFLIPKLAKQYDKVQILSASLQIVSVLASLVQRFHFRLDESHLIETHPLITFRPKHGIKLFLEAV